MADVPVVTASEDDLLSSTAAGSAAIRGSTWRVGGFVAGLVVGLASTAVLARHLQDVRFGQYAAATTLIAIVAGLSDLGLTAIGVRELSVRVGADRDALARNLLGLRVVVSVVGVLVVTAFAEVAGYGTTLVVGVLLAGFGLVLQSCQSTMTIALISELRLPWVAALDFLRALLTALFVFALALANARLLPFLAISIPVGFVVLTVNALVVRGRVPLLPTFHSGQWRRIMSGALPYTLAVAASTLYTYVAVIIVSLLTNKYALGYFGASARAMQILLVFPGLAVSTALPIFSRAARDDRVRLAYALGRVFEVSLLLGSLCALALTIGARIAIDVLGGSFIGATPLLSIQAAGLGASFVGAVWANGLISVGRYRSILMISVGSLLGGTVLIVVLVLLDGVRGAAIATMAGEVVLVVANGAALVHADRSLMPPLGIVPKVAAAIGLAALTTLAPLPVLASVVVASGTYVAVVVALGAVPAEVRQELRLRSRR